MAADRPSMAKAWDPAAASAKHVTKYKFVSGGNSDASPRDRKSYTALHAFAEQRIFVCEVGVQRLAGDLRFAGDVVHRGLPVAEPEKRRTEQSGATLGGRGSFRAP
ncbi:MAG TPA: hypothetical protein VF403_25270 [Kofleriaceae bacterium]